jgi:hypothetical protein
MTTSTKGLSATEQDAARKPNPLGASRRVPQVDMSTKVGPHRNVSRPPSEMSASSGKPPADWPSNPTKFESGKARSTFHGPTPSREAPPR